jgi:hypothetical protein
VRLHHPLPLALAVLAVAPAAADAATANPQRFVTRPDLRPPGIRITTSTPQATPGLTFAAPKRDAKGSQAGNVIFDLSGEPVYFRPSQGTSMEFRVQRYQDRPVLTWWEGKGFRGYGEGTGYVVDQQYHQVATVKAGNGVKADFHEFKLTDRGTALLLFYKAQKRDLRSFGGQKNGRVMENGFQEVDLATGKVLVDWRAQRHVSPRDAYHPVPQRSEIPWDFFHINSVNLDTDGNFLVSSRSTHTIFKIDRRSGKILWRLGGKRSTFKLGRGVRFLWQHDVHRRADGTISIFDNRARDATQRVSGRGIILRVDEAARTASLVREYRRPGFNRSPNQGNFQTTETGNLLAGWGGENPYMTEFAPDGRIVWEARFARRPTESYRAYRQTWHAQPTTAPKVAARRAGATTAVRASWNGATTVARWRVLAGPTDAQLVPVGERTRTGFETLVTVPGAHARVAVEALDAGGNVLSRSKVAAADRRSYVVE